MPATAPTMPCASPARSCSAKVVGEGANLGMTQRGRIEFAARGGRLNTDFIDNSAGVNTSDQEVNIKIALGPAVRSGQLTTHARNALLTEMTEDVAAASLRNNYQQSLALSLAERRSVRDLPDYPLLMRALEARGLLDRPLEALPSDEELLERARAGRGLTPPGARGAAELRQDRAVAGSSGQQRARRAAARDRGFPPTSPSGCASASPATSRSTSCAARSSPPGSPMPSSTAAAR